MDFLTVLFVIGITAEGVTGALAAGRERMDLFGVVMIACVTGIGGGSIRDILLGHYPLSWVEHPYYLVLISVAAIVTVSIASIMRHFKTLFLVLDALGLAVFAIFGARVALEMGYGLVIAVAGAVITGVFGGVLRDLLCNRIPLVFREELYASVAILVALLYVGLTHLGVTEVWTAVAALVFGFGLRLAAIWFRLRLPVFDYQAVQHRADDATRRHPWSLRRRAADD